MSYLRNLNIDFWCSDVLVLFYFSYLTRFFYKIICIHPKDRSNFELSDFLGIMKCENANFHFYLYNRPLSSPSIGSSGLFTCAAWSLDGLLDLFSTFLIRISRKLRLVVAGGLSALTLPATLPAATARGQLPTAATQTPPARKRSSVRSC